MGVRLPRSLRNQFILAVTVLALLILAGGITAVYALHVNTEATRMLVEKRLGQMQDGQDLVRRTLLIEREAYQLGDSKSFRDMRDSYVNILNHLESFDRNVDRLAATDNDLDVLDLHQSSQLFRNTVNIVGQLRESEFGSTALVLKENSDSRLQFLKELREQAGVMVVTTQIQSDRITQEYRSAMLTLAETSRRNQQWVIVLLSASLLLAWGVTRGFLGKHVLARLQLVSESLRETGGGGEERFKVPVQGQDEIGAMARAVEQFQDDRRQLALVNAALLIEKTRQEDLIRKLAEAHSQLLQSEKLASIGQLAAGVAHEINNPVAFVNSNLGTLQGYVADLFKTLEAYEQSESEMSPATQKSMRDLKKQIDIVYLREDVSSLLTESMSGLQRVKRIVQDLRDFSHIDESDKQWVHLENCLDSTLNVVWHSLKDKADVLKEYGGTPEIECMPSQMNQVFMNLLINAGQAIEKYGQITLRTNCDDTAVWAEVEDTGSGIASDNLDRVFDPFFTTKPVGTGTGLGLSIAYGIVNRHGGRIEVKSVLGKGTTFKVLFPRSAIAETVASDFDTA